MFINMVKSQKRKENSQIVNQYVPYDYIYIKHTKKLRAFYVHIVSKCWKSIHQI